MAPRNPSSTWPPTTATTIGMLCTCRAARSCGFASMSTLASTQAPSASAASFSRIGPSCLHGPHHSAHKSMITGTLRDRSTTSALNVSSVTSMTCPAGGPSSPPAAGVLDAFSRRCAAACRAPRSTAPWSEKSGCCMTPSCRIPCTTRAPSPGPPGTIRAPPAFSPRPHRPAGQHRSQRPPCRPRQPYLVPRPLRRSERRGLEVAAPLVSQRAADLAERRLRAGRVEHRRDHVRARARGRQHGRDGGIDSSLITAGPAHGKLAYLITFHVMADPQDLHRLLDGLGVAVHADDPLLALLQLLLVGEGRLGGLRHEPAVLDAAQDAAGHRAVRAHPADLGEGFLGRGLQPVGQRLDVPGTAQRIRDAGDAGLLHDHLLGAQRDLRGLLAGQREYLVQRVGVQRVRAAEHRRERLDSGPDHVVVWLLRSEGYPGCLGVESQPLSALGARAVHVAYPPRPDPAGGAELGDLLEEVDMRIEEK